MRRFPASFCACTVVFAITGFSLGGCVGTEDFPPVDVEPAPPTMLERQALGLDADVPYFLDKFRRCAAFASYGYCRNEMYGGGEI